VLTIALIPRIHVGTDMLKFFKEDSRLVEDTEVFNRDMSGSQIVTVMINAPEPGDILDPIFLTALDGFDEYLRENSPNARKIQTLVPNIKRINRLMNRDTVPYQVVSRNESIDFFSGDGVLTMDWIGAEDNEAVEENLLNTGTDKTSMTYDEFAELLQEVVLSNGGSIEVDDFVEAILAGGNYDGAAFNEIPSDPAKYGLETREELRNLLSQYLVLYSGNLSMVINDALEPDKTLITVQIDNVDQSVQQQLLDHIKAYWDFYLPEKWSYEIGGGGTLAYVLSSLVTRSQLISLLVALVVVWLIVSIMFRSPVAGFLGLIPVAFALVGIFLFMILFGFSLDIVTSILASLAIGIGVDYSIHVMDAFRRSLAAGIGNTLQEVYSTTGKAVFINALSVAVGFMGLLISRFVPIQQMAVLFSVAMIFACGASLVVLPLVLLKLDPKFLKKHMTNKPPTALPERLDNILVKEK